MLPMAEKPQGLNASEGQKPPLKLAYTEKMKDRNR